MRMLRKTLCLGLMLALASSIAWAAAAPAADDYPDLAAKIAGAKPLKVEDVCTPLTTSRRGEMMWVPNPDGKTYDLLQWYWRGYGGPTEVHIIDTATGETSVGRIPDRRQIHICGRTLAPNGKLYIATPDWRKGMEIYVYDPAANKLTSLGMQVPGLAGEKRPLSVAPNGKIYGAGSHMKERKAGCYEIDPETDKVTPYGPIGPSHAPHGVWGYSSAADGRYVYVASGKIP